jgi:hypothetical protein
LTGKDFGKFRRNVRESQLSRRSPSPKVEAAGGTQNNCDPGWQRHPFRKSFRARQIRTRAVEKKLQRNPHFAMDTEIDVLVR